MAHALVYFLLAHMEHEFVVLISTEQKPTHHRENRSNLAIQWGAEDAQFGGRWKNC